MNQQLSRILEEHGARFVRVLCCDNANVIRAKAVHVSALASILDYGLGITRAQQAMAVMFDAVVAETGLSPVGEVRLMPDWPTLKAIPYAPGHMRVMGDMYLDGKPWSLCPRDFLRRMIKDAADSGFEVKAAFEYEFYLLRPTADGIRPVDDTVFAATISMDLNRPVIDDIAQALLEQGIPVEMYYPESGPGQQEISVGYTDALAAADRQIVFRETAHAIANRHGLKASFVPKVFADKAGSGCHVHFSLWRGDQNLMPEARGVGGLSPSALQFMAGVLYHLPALMAITTPSPNSYQRIRPHCWSGAYRCWGLDNREAALRVPTNPAGSGTTNIELKTVDASANPYLALGALIAAGLDGVRRGLEPRPPVQVDPGTLSEEARREQDISALPADLGAAIGFLSSDQVLLDALGPELARAFLAIRRAEWQALGSMELSDQVKLLLERY